MEALKLIQALEHKGFECSYLRYQLAWKEHLEELQTEFIGLEWVEQSWDSFFRLWESHEAPPFLTKDRTYYLQYGRQFRLPNKLRKWAEWKAGMKLPNEATCLSVETLSKGEKLYLQTVTLSFQPHKGKKLGRFRVPASVLSNYLPSLEALTTQIESERAHKQTKKKAAKKKSKKKTWTEEDIQEIVGNL